MKIRAGFIIDYDDISMKEAGEIEETIQRQMDLIIKKTLKLGNQKKEFSVLHQHLQKDFF